jgi:hypothetical protein
MLIRPRTGDGVFAVVQFAQVPPTRLKEPDQVDTLAWAAI